jgi:hypothetical protein
MICFLLEGRNVYLRRMDFDADFPEVELNTLQNEFTGGSRESLAPPEPNEPICLISYEVTFILLGDGPKNRSSFWRSYRRELALNKKTGYQNYHISVCRHYLISLKMRLDQPVYFRFNRLTTEKQLDPFTIQALADPHFK